MFRKILFWTHLIVGVTCGLIILLMSVTGVLLTYEKQMLAWSDRSERSAAPSEGAQPMGVADLIAAAEKERGALPNSVVISHDPSELVQASYGRGDTLLLNAYTGEEVEAGSEGMRQFFREVTSWHRWLGVSGEGRAKARMITGWVNLGFLFLVVSGMYLWLPRVFAWKNFRAVLLFRGGVSGKARDFNWHNVVGIWMAVPLFFVVLSGVVISFPWASRLVYTAVGEEAPVRGKGGPRGFGKAGLQGFGKGGPKGFAKGRGREGLELPEVAGEPLTLDFSGMDAVLSKAKATVPEWRSITLTVPTENDVPVPVNVQAGYAGQPQLRSSFEVCRLTGNVEEMRTWEDQSAGQRARSWLRFVHTGEYYGLIGQTIAGLASAAGALLVYTGLALAWRRFWAWLNRTRCVE